MTENHPITPPPELVQQWRNEGYGLPGTISEYVATRAAQWGADQELEACLSWLTDRERFPVGHEAIEDLKADRRPKPPSLKEQALEDLAWVDKNLKGANFFGRCDAVHTIRRALEQLDD
jgi:hypothetical protein